MSLTRVTKKKLEGVPASVPEMEALALKVLEASRERESLVRDKAAAMEAAAAPFTKRLEELEKSVDDGMELLEMWAEINSSQFGKLRSLEIAGAHRMGWRMGNWKSSPKKGSNWKLITEKLVDFVKAQRPKAADLLRTKVEPDREAMVAMREDPDAVALLEEAGVDIAQEETFFLA